MNAYCKYVIAISLVVTGCASVPDDGGISKVAEIYSKQVGEEVELPSFYQPSLSAEMITELVSASLSVDKAEQLALGANPAVRSMLGIVGIAESDYAQAARLENPGIAFERFSHEDYSASVLFDLGGIFLMPLKRKIERQQLERSRYEAAIGIMNHVAETRQAWFEAVAAKQITLLTEKTLLSADTANELIREMSAIGHSSVVEAAKSETLVAQMQANVLRVRLAEMAAREKLIRKLGLWGTQARELKLPDNLPELPASPISLDSVEREAIKNRLDVQLARANLEAMASNLKLSRRSPFLSATEVGPVFESAGGERERGYEIELRLPIFDTGSVKNLRSRIMVEQARADAETIAIASASQAREAMATYLSSWDIANNMESVVMPLRERITNENMLAYNGMLISVFDLLTDVRSAVQTEIDAVNSNKEFWLADLALQQALTGAGMDIAAMSTGTSVMGNESNDH